MKTKSHEDIALNVLAYEFRETDIEDNNRKIRRKIGARAFDTLPPDWLPNLRALKNSLQAEISKMECSKYHNVKDEKHADMSHFEIAKMTDDYCKSFPSIDRNIIKGFIPFAVHLYYLR